MKVVAVGVDFSPLTHRALRLALEISAPHDAEVLLVEVAGNVEADLLVVGSHGRGLVKRLFLGSVSEGALRHAPCPVLVVPDPSWVQEGG